MKILMALVLLTGSVSYALAEQKPVKKIDLKNLQPEAPQKKKNTKELEVPDFSGMNEPQKSKDTITFKSECTDNTGRTLNHNDPGFAACMSSKTSNTQSGPDIR
ncbi:MAG: hypothetical protein AB7O96_13475 [Pseudobdellovibrionaceae bacterium]